MGTKFLELPRGQGMEWLEVAVLDLRSDEIDERRRGIRATDDLVVLVR